jgi:hypothetical protein
MAVRTARGCWCRCSTTSPITTWAPTACVGHLDGELLARPTPSGFADAALLPPFTEVGVTTSEGPDNPLDCAPLKAIRAVAEVVGELVVVEQDAEGTWTAVLGEPVEPSVVGDIGRPVDFDGRSRDRFRSAIARSSTSRARGMHLPRPANHVHRPTTRRLSCPRCWTRSAPCRSAWSCGQTAPSSAVEADPWDR